MCPADGLFNDGNVDFEIIVEKNTKISIIGIYNKDISSEPTTIEWNDIGSAKGKIRK